MTVEINSDVINNYTIPDLTSKIIDALMQVKEDLSKCTIEDFSTFDQFHLQGLQATRSLANKVPIKPYMKVLDIGSGIGGAARILSTEFGAQVYGIEVVEEYFKAAQTLSALLHLETKTQFFHGSALDLPFKNNFFDVVWMQHMNMNIKDKLQLYTEATRVLHDTGKIGLFEICKGANTHGQFYFPVPWAADASINHLISKEDLISLIRHIGFETYDIVDVTEECALWVRNAVNTLNSNMINPLGLNLVTGDDLLLKMNNLLLNFEKQNVEVIFGIFSKKKEGKI